MVGLRTSTLATCTSPWRRSTLTGRPVVLTIGHSKRALDEFTDILKAHEVTRLVDVRTFPRSYRNPQFNIDTLPGALASAGIAYTHIAGLGGRRRPRADSPNSGWRNDSFRGYADYMQTVEFSDGLQKLTDLARRDRVAVMCAEAVPWRCHRSLIGDALLVRGFAVGDIFDARKRQPHRLTPFAKVDGERITYPSPAA